MQSTLVLLLSTSAMALRTPPRLPPKTFVREAEIKHGRVALTAGAVLAGLSAQGFEHPAMVLSQCPVSHQILFFSAIGVLGSFSYLPRMSSGFRFKDQAVPGRVSDAFPTPTDRSIFTEDISGRAAMLAVAAFLLVDSSTAL